MFLREKIWIRARKAADNAVVTIEDTGIGIPQKDRQQIFDRFYRVDKARSREAGGAGLGLSIVWDTVVANGGTSHGGWQGLEGARFLLCICLWC